MPPAYAIADTSAIFSPGLVFFKDHIQANLARMIELAGSPDRLRPHVKTHKCPDIVRLELEAGIRKHKCATLAEADMLASAGAPDVLLAYPVVGPNVHRVANLITTYPGTRFSVLADDLGASQTLSSALSSRGLCIDVFLDVDVGQHRTGIGPGPEAVSLYEQIDKLPGLKPAGLHVYDGHTHQDDQTERRSAALRQLEPVFQLRSILEGKSLPVPSLIVGGTPTFPIHAGLDVPGLECAPGTCVLHDHGYGSRYGDVSGFTPAALLLTRVISRPLPTRVTFDLGYKAVASDPPAGKRCLLLGVPDYQVALQSEEHFAVDTPHAGRYKPGDEVLAIPTHVCPTVALHRFAYVVEQGKLAGTWEITARDRVLRV
jgi:D-serine deaminase-like pyridoxal phosphate-dependent protein